MSKRFIQVKKHVRDGSSGAIRLKPALVNTDKVVECYENSGGYWTIRFDDGTEIVVDEGLAGLENRLNVQP
jgi:hypothetical protein